MKNYIKVVATIMAVFLVATVITVGATDTPVFTIGNGGQFNARIDDNGEITVPVTVTNWPGDKVAAVQVDVFFDNTALEFVTLEAQMKTDLGVMLMPVAPTWIYNVDAANASGKMTASFLDTSLGSQCFTPNSINDETNGTNVLFNLKFKVLDETIDTGISINDVLIGEFSTGTEVKYTVSDETLSTEDCVVLPYVASDDTSLADLTINGETIAGFGPEVEYYELEVSNEVDQAVIDVVTNDANATYEILSDTALTVGENTIEILVTAEDGETVYYYTIVITRLPSTDTSLADLTINGETIEGFDPEGEYYEIEVENDVTTLDLGIVTTHENATYEIDGNKDFEIGENEVLITVTAEDGESKYYYTIMVTRLPSTDTSLADLTINGETIEGFDPEGEYYEIEVENDVTTLDLGIVTTHENATYEIDGNKDFEIGENEVLITVTAEDGESKYYYTIMVTRMPSTDATLADLTIDGVTVEGFAADTYEYEVEVENDVTEVIIDATANHENADVEISGDEYILPGKNIFTITVTAEDGETTETYSIVVIRKLIFTVIENTENYGSCDVIITKVDGADGLRTMNVEGAEVVLTKNDEEPVFFVISTTPVTDYDVDFIDETPVVSIIGNVDNNEVLNIFDATGGLSLIASGTNTLPYAQQFIADADTNGIINIFDATTILRIVAGGKPPVFN